MNKRQKSKIFNHNIFEKNRRGADKIISVYWFAILFIVAGAVAYMVLSFYGEPYDIRELEANALTNKIAGCFSEGGYLKPEIFVDGTFNEKIGENLLEHCSLNFDVEGFYGWDNDQYYVEVEFLDFDVREQVFEKIVEGNRNLKFDCGKGRNSPVCLERSFYAVSNPLEGEQKQYQINILSIVRKTEKNVQ